MFLLVLLTTYHTNPFRPGQPIDPKYFGGRKKELDIFEECLNYSSTGNLHHLAVMGERGIGKSSLLRKYDDLATDRGFLAVRRELDTTVDSINSLMEFMLYALKASCTSIFSARMKASSRTRKFFQNYSLNVSIMGSGVSVQRQGGVSLLQDVFYDEFARVWAEVKNEIPAIVFLLDEAERLQQIEGSWSFLRTLFTRFAESNMNYMLVVAGKLDLFRGIREIHSPMERFFLPLEIKEMVLDETREILERPMEAFQRKFKSDAVQKVYEKSGGHPYVVQTFGFFAFETGEKNLDARVFDSIVPVVMSRLSVQLFKERFDSASPKEREILGGLAKLYGPSTPKSVSRICDVPLKTVWVALDRLVNKYCVNKVGRGNYSLFTPLFGEYVKATIQ